MLSAVGVAAPKPRAASAGPAAAPGGEAERWERSPWVQAGQHGVPRVRPAVLLDFLGASAAVAPPASWMVLQVRPRKRRPRPRTSV